MEFQKIWFMQITLLTENQRKKTLEAKFHSIITVCEEFGYVYGYENTLENRRHAEDKM
jgi:hypothetical protein